MLLENFCFLETSSIGLLGFLDILKGNNSYYSIVWHFFVLLNLSGSIQFLPSVVTQRYSDRVLEHVCKVPLRLLSSHAGFVKTCNRMFN